MVLNRGVSLMDEAMSERLAERHLSPSAPLKACREVEAAATDIWSVIAERGNLTNVHPFCQTTQVERWPGPDSRDHIHYYSGIHYQRDCISWFEGEGYDLEVGPPGAKTALARWEIERLDVCRAKFSIEVVSYVRSDLSADRVANYVRDIVEGSIPTYLDGVVRGVAHFVETGIPVSRNQFGPHAIYSP